MYLIIPKRNSKQKRNLKIKIYQEVSSHCDVFVFRQRDKEVENWIYNNWLLKKVYCWKKRLRRTCWQENSIHWLQRIVSLRVDIFNSVLRRISQIRHCTVEESSKTVTPSIDIMMEEFKAVVLEKGESEHSDMFKLIELLTLLSIKESESNETSYRLTPWQINEAGRVLEDYKFDCRGYWRPNSNSGISVQTFHCKEQNQWVLKWLIQNIKKTFDWKFEGESRVSRFGETLVWKMRSIHIENNWSIFFGLSEFKRKQKNR